MATTHEYLFEKLDELFYLLGESVKTNQITQSRITEGHSRLSKIITDCFMNHYPANTPRPRDTRWNEYSKLGNTLEFQYKKYLELAESMDKSAQPLHTIIELLKEIKNILKTDLESQKALKK